MLGSGNKLMYGNFRLTLEQKIIMNKKISNLPRLERLAIYFHFWEQCPQTKIANNLGIPSKDVPELLKNAMTKLRFDFLEIADSYFGVLVPSKMELPA